MPRTRTNATSACMTCKKRHERCLRLSEGQICTNCEKHNRDCIPVPGNKRGPKPRGLRSRSTNFQPYPNINSYGATEIFQNTFVNQSPSSYYSFVHDESMPNHERNITFFPNSFSTSYYFEAPHSYNEQNSFSSYLSDSVGISLPYNNVMNTSLNINPFEITETFQNTSINKSPSLSSSSSSFIHDEQEPNNEPYITSSFNSFSTGCSNDSSFFETQHSHNNGITTTFNITPYGTADAFQNT
ncbi:12983_t:CDS:1, partial [Racocetra fulgida]